MESQHPILLFDGQCNLCNGSIRFIYPRDPLGNLRYANLQSNTGKSLLIKHSLPMEYFDSLVLVDGDKIYSHSDGAINILKYLHFPWPLVRKILLIIPVRLRDLAYNWIARNRYSWFGKTDTCQIPTKELQARFLD